MAGRRNDKSIREKVRTQALDWITRALGMNLATSGHRLLTGLQSLLIRDTEVDISRPVPFLLASLLNPSLEGAKKLVDIVLEGNSLVCLAHLNLLTEHGKGRELEEGAPAGGNRFWHTTVEDVKALAGSSPIEDFHWITSAFLGDRDKKKIRGKRGVEFIGTFDHWTLASSFLFDQLGLTFAYTDIPAELEFQYPKRSADIVEWEKKWTDFINTRTSDFSKRLRHTLITYFLQCQRLSRPTYSCLLGLSHHEGKVLVEPVDLWPSIRIGKQKSKFELEGTVALSLEGFISLDLIRQFEEILNSSKLSESTLQDFLEKHPDFLFLIGEHDEYKSQVSLLPQILLSYDSREGGRPDFLLRDSRTKFWDILEIKSPDLNLVKGIPRRRRWSDLVMESKAQLIEYGRYFDDKANRQWVRDKYGIDILSPKLYLLIGRDLAFMNWAEKRKLTISEREIEIMTYDDLLHLAKRRWLLHPLSS